MASSGLPQQPQGHGPVWGYIDGIHTQFQRLKGISLTQHPEAQALFEKYSNDFDDWSVAVGPYTSGQDAHTGDLQGLLATLVDSKSSPNLDPHTPLRICQY